MMCKCCLLLLFTWLLTPAFATHIVGGELNYRCLGNDLYEIRLTVYRDCYNGVPFFDNPAAIGVFDINNVLINTAYTLVRNNDTLDPNLSDPCLVTPPNICYHTTTYLDTISLPFRAGGYQLVYQRCCRNNTINNLINPGATGATYYTYITEAALLSCNSNPVFRNWPPPLICNNQPIRFDHSAYDLDGDSLVYELCTPFEGATTSNPMPQPPNNPPYGNVVFVPPYSLANVMGGVPLTIHPSNGLLTGTPNTVGQFVVGVCVKEYRNGQLISITRRDFQYNVGICQLRNNASFFTPSITCDSTLSMNFLNFSQAQVPTFSWDFGVAGISTDTSSLPFPTYTYPDTGYYQVRLIVAPGTLCSDTMVGVVNIRFKTISGSFDTYNGPCSDSVTMAFTDQSSDSEYPITNWFWDFGNGQTSTLQNPSHTFRQSGNYPISLYVTSSIGCTDTIVDTLNLRLATFVENDTVYVCQSAANGPNSVQLNVGGNPGLTYQWSPSIGLSNPNVASPIASPTATTTYSVTVSAFNPPDTCTVVKNVTVVVIPSIPPPFPADSSFCGGGFLLIPQVTLPGVANWYSLTSNGPVFIGSNNALPVNITSDTSFVMVFLSPTGCGITDTLRILSDNTPVDAQFDFDFVGCTDSIVIRFNNQSVVYPGFPIINYSWSFGNGGFSNQQNPTAIYNQNGNYRIRLAVENVAHCIDSLVKTINLQIPEVLGSDTFLICRQNGLASPVQLNPGGNPNLRYRWSPALGLNNANIASPLANPTNTTLYRVTVTTVSGVDSCSIFEEILVKVDDTPILNLPQDTAVCGGSTNIFAQNSSNNPIGWYDLVGGVPQFLGNGNPLSLNITQNMTIVARATSNEGCSATDTTNITSLNTPVDADFAFSIVECDDSLTVSFQDQTSSPMAPLSNWRWDFGDTGSSSLQNPRHIYGSSGTFVITLTATLNALCSSVHTDTLELVLPEINIPFDTAAVCLGDSVRLGITGAPNVSYSWTPTTFLSNPNIPNPMATPTATTTYQVLARTINSFGNCVATENVHLHVPPPVSVALPNSISSCDEWINVSGQATNAVSFEWSDNNLFSTIISTTNTPTQAFNPISPTNYFLRASDSFGCGSMDSILVIPLKARISTDSSQRICLGDTLTLQAVNLRPADQITWDWQPRSSILGPSNASFVFVNPRVNTTYMVVGRNQHNCLDTAYANVGLLNQLPVVSLSISQDTVFVGETIQLNAATASQNAFVWTPNPALNRTDILNPDATPTENTTFIIQVTNSDGCRGVDSVSVFAKRFICDMPFIFVPNTFTPNGDGENDVLFVRSNVLTELEFVVYNRWGEKVFETHDVSIGWDGYYQGSPCAPDAFAFYLKAKCIGGLEYFTKGDINLIR